MAGVTWAVQKAQRDADTGIELRTPGTCASASSTSSSVFMRASRWFTGFTTKKNTTAAMVTKVIRALRKSPYLNSLPLIVKVRQRSPACRRWPQATG